jgi:hypothetical protein
MVVMAQDLRLRRYINYDAKTKNFAVTINFGGILATLDAHYTSYLAAEDAYNLWLTKCEAIFNNLNEASKLSFHSPDKDVTGTVDTRTLAVEYDVQSDEVSEADVWHEDPTIHDDELQEIASELRDENDVDPEETDEPYEPYERIHTEYDPIRYE